MWFQNWKTAKTAAVRKPAPVFVIARNCESHYKFQRNVCGMAQWLAIRERHAKERDILRGNRSSQLLEWAEKLGVRVCNYLLALEVYISSSAACMVRRPGLPPRRSTGEAWRPSEFWFLIFAVVKESKRGLGFPVLLSGEETGLVDSYGFWEWGVLHLD